MADIISGTEMRAAILDELRQEVEAIREKHGTVPGLVTILVGENPASISYVTLKVKTALSLGFHEIQDNQPADVSEEALLALIDKYNRDPSIHGILVQLPLPKHIDENKVIYAIDPDKDVDGFHPVNLGRMVTALYACGHSGNAGALGPKWPGPKSWSLAVPISSASPFPSCSARRGPVPTPR